MKMYSVSVMGKSGTKYVSVKAEDTSDAIEQARERVGDPTAIYSTHEWRN
jgi:hypothetical protein